MALTTTMARVRSRADDLKVSARISARQLAVLVDMSPTVLGNCFQGVTYCGAEKERELSDTTLLLVELELALKPCRLPEKNDDLRALLDFVRENKTEPTKVREAVRSLFGVGSNE